MNKEGKFVARGELPAATKRLTRPCTDCPMRRDALPGWLGGASAEEYRQLAHSDIEVDCHVHEGSPCAGMSIYRTNTCKWQPKELKLPADHEAVFSGPVEFLEHHSQFGRAHNASNPN